MGIFDILIDFDNHFTEEMDKIGLKKFVNKLSPYAKEAIHFDVDKINEKKIPIGKTKIGGHPDVDDDFIWPKSNERFLTFLAQINLNEISPFDKQKVLPQSGMLYFFYDCEEMLRSVDIKDKSFFKVIFAQSNQNLKRQEFPESLQTNFNTCNIKIRNKWSLPSLEEVNFSFKTKIQDKYLNYVALEDGKETYMLGYSKNIQGDVRYECLKAQLVDDDDNIKLEQELLIEAQNDWILLFQLDSIDVLNMMWGDMGMLYFMIKKQDLIKRNFSDAWVVLQCY